MGAYLQTPLVEALERPKVLSQDSGIAHLEVVWKSGVPRLGWPATSIPSLKSTDFNRSQVVSGMNQIDSRALKYFEDKDTDT